MKPYKSRFRQKLKIRDFNCSHLDLMGVLTKTIAMITSAPSMRGLMKERAQERKRYYQVFYRVDFGKREVIE